MNKRILSFIVACLMVVSTFIISRPLVHVHAVEGESKSEGTGVTVNYVADLSLNNPNDGSFFVGGMKKADGTIVRVDDTPKTAWGSYIGNWLVNGETYINTNTETTDATILFDMKNRTNYTPVLGFIAPEDGVFSVKAELVKVWSGKFKVTVITEDGTEYWSKEVSGNGAVANVDAKDITLSKGEMLLVVATYVSGESGIGYRSMSVEALYAECPHSYENGSVCDYCGETCTHTTPAVVDDKTVCDNCGAELNLVNVKHSADISANKTVNGQFFIGALRFSDGAVRAVETTPRATWSDAWPGNWIAGWEGTKGYVTQYSEWGTEGLGSGYDPRIKFDFYYTADETHGGLVGFTAPADGIFNIDVLLRKVGGGNPYVKVLKNDGTQLLDPIKVNGWGAEVEISLDSVALKKGEQVLIVACVGEGGKNIGFISYDVDAFYTTCPHFFGEDSKCTVCGADCTHLPTIVDKKSVCAICNAVLGSAYTVHSADLSVNKTINGQFFIGAIELSTNTVLPVEETARKTWGDAWPGNWIEGVNAYVTAVPEYKDSGFMFDLYFTSDGVYGALVGFTAPEDGVFNVSAALQKVYSGTPRVTLMKNDGTILDSVDLSYGLAVTVGAKNVALNKGEQILVVVEKGNYGSGQRNVGFKSFTVEAVYTECPHTDWANGECTICGADCNHEWNNGVCDNCGIEHDHQSWVYGGESHIVICEECGFVCPHTERDADYICTVCGHECEDDHNFVDGTCTICGFTCEEHIWAYADGICTICGASHTHIGGKATCQKGAECSTCGYVYTGVDADNHGETSYVANGDKTHKVVCEFGCVIDEDAACVLDENDVCKDCKHDYTVEIAEDNFTEVFDSIYNGGETDHVAEGPTSLEDLNAAVKGEDVNGFTYGGFNLEMNETIGNTVKLRHHILLDGNLTVKVNGEEVVLTNVSGNYYYFEVEVEIGKFSEAHTITVGETTVVTASVHSYMKTAFEADKKNPTALTDAQENLLKALYDWDYAVANK